MGDHGFHRLSVQRRRARLYQPRRRQARPGSDRSGEGGRELRVRSRGPLSDHRTDHGARARVPSSRHLRDGPGHLRCRVDRRARSMARHESGQHGEERPDASRAARGGGAGGRRRRQRAVKTAAAAAADPFAETAAAPTAPPSEFSDAVAIQIPTAGADGRPQALLHLRRRPELGGSLVLRSGPPRSPSVHRPGKRGHRAERHGGCHRCRELRPGRMVGHLQAAASRKLGRAVRARRVPADRLLGLGRVLARAWQQARSHGVVLHLRRAGSGHIGRRPDGEDGAAHSRHRADCDRLGCGDHGPRPPRGDSAESATQQPAATSV